MAPGVLGPRIRSLRLQRRLTLKEVADDTVHRLGAGDSIRFDCSVPHRIANPGRRQLRCIWAITPPTF